MAKQFNWVFCMILFISIFIHTSAFIAQPSRINKRVGTIEKKIDQSALFAHHPQKKAIKKIMQKRPRKSRPSDILRRNVNLNKCISQFSRDIPDYTEISEEEYECRKEEFARNWVEGNPNQPWIMIDEEVPNPFVNNDPNAPKTKKFPFMLRRSRSF